MICIVALSNMESNGSVYITRLKVPGGGLRSTRSWNIASFDLPDISGAANVTWPDVLKASCILISTMSRERLMFVPTT